MEISKYIKLDGVTAINNVLENGIRLKNNEFLVNIKKDYKNILVKKYLINETKATEDRIVDSLKLVNIGTDILNKKVNILSSSEQMKIELAILLIRNDPCIVLYEFDKYFMEKELLFFKKLFKKLVSKYHKTIVLINSNLTFMFDLVDRIVVFESKRKVVTFDNPSFYDEKLLSLLGIPKIVEFVNYLNLNDKKIKEYTDINELIKAIFREV